jgi:hypothetical protein
VSYMSILNVIPQMAADLIWVAIASAMVLALGMALWGTKKQQKRARKLLRLLLQALSQKPGE